MNVYNPVRRAAGERRVYQETEGTQRLVHVSGQSSVKGR